MKEGFSTSRPIQCRYCGQPTVYGPENPFRPFCSERCRLMDLGAWADEQFRVPTEDSGEIPELEAQNADDEEN